MGEKREVNERKGILAALFMISELRFSKQTNRGESLAKGKE